MRINFHGRSFNAQIPIKGPIQKYSFCKNRSNCIRIYSIIELFIHFLSIKITLHHFIDENHNKLSVATLANLKNAVKEVKADDSNGRFQIWVNKLQTFFDNHLLPAFALRKEVDKTLVGSSDLT